MSLLYACLMPQRHDICREQRGRAGIESLQQFIARQMVIWEDSARYLAARFVPHPLDRVRRGIES